MAKLEELRKFLVASQRRGYAAERPSRREPDGSSTIEWSEGKWRSHDNFFGGDPFAGRTMVFEHEKPVFAIVYYGRIGPEVRETAPVYAFLREALRLAPTELPVRGPRDYAKESLHYRNSWNGDLAGFSGEEQIEQDKQLIYLGVYGGGLIALRSG